MKEEDKKEAFSEVKSIIASEKAASLKAASAANKENEAGNAEAHAVTPARSMRSNASRP